MLLLIGSGVVLLSAMNLKFTFAQLPPPEPEYNYSNILTISIACAFVALGVSFLIIRRGRFRPANNS